MDIFPNETVIFQWFLFMTALLALNFGVFRPVLHLIKERRERTAGEKEKAREMMERADRLVSLCQTRLAEARGVGSKMREERLREGEAHGRDLVAKARVVMDQKMEGLRKQLEAETRQAGLQLKQYAQGLGTEMAEKILERTV